ncbi:catechol 2,3-dioxygenase [Schinkia azotoformans]|uniref:Metapyrocatechase n=1 Tax=Schinkia azotoformans LMG 9581 TaxID=1131731 RepID=K6D682_SCHAZ|nr:catechol 2,3-dioxygenase [Schinkia azotoformans]EKN63548.1 catechol 2,3 dioxygenase [Schinkia azotoformans LMG 9581]MEC1638848.1 catechol 2,3-dioxygenase [Schinkia azotoformans]MEC1720874.1 catechol 2,3-dioxygenase [Schinkia azotoformans]MEC1946813.1 catechol 2,3-dioxygenase [Schinkia azotoformans]MED4353174.1 catechol 2,3-dioxygenase [Schinkia azotoformans]
MAIMRLGRVEIGCPNWEKSIEYYKNVIGLIEVAREEDRVYLKAWDEHDHHSVILKKNDSAGLVHLAFKCEFASDLDLYEEKLNNYGVTTERVPAGTRLAEGEAVRFVIPTGQTVELYSEIEVVGNGLPLVNPDPWPDGLVGMHPTRLDHLLVAGDDVDGAVKIFTDLFDFHVSEQLVAGENNDVTICKWLFKTNTAHDIAIIKGPQNGLHHFAFWLDEWVELRNAADIMAKNDVMIDAGPTRHGITRGTTIYFFDPSGNRNEVFCGGYITYPDSPTITWTEDTIGKAIFYFERELNERFTTVFS